MTEELKQAAQQAPKIKELVEQLRNIANGVRICGVDDRRFVAGRLDEIADALTQRPAAQDEREAPYGYCPECGAPGVTRERRPDGDDKCSNGHRYPSRSAHASLPTQPAAQDEREADEVFLPRRLAATQKLTQLGYRYDSAHGKWLPAPQQATPEPVGEPFGYFRALPFGWEQCGEHDDGAVALYTRHAPGVPEGWRDAFDLAAQMLTWGRDEGLTPEQVNEVDAHAKLMFAMLAAQAKGADK